jgi:hypothetical protein
MENGLIEYQHSPQRYSDIDIDIDIERPWPESAEMIRADLASYRHISIYPLFQKDADY